ncbi:MAG: chromosome partitioning protein ParB, partial [Opitutia bacterium]
MATPPKKSLGRGLGSLIGGGVVKSTAPAPVTVAAAAPVAPGLQLQELLLTSIVPNPRQPRRDFDDAQVKELADS